MNAGPGERASIRRAHLPTRSGYMRKERRPAVRRAGARGGRRTADDRRSRLLSAGSRPSCRTDSSPASTLPRSAKIGILLAAHLHACSAPVHLCAALHHGNGHAENVLQDARPTFPRRSTAFRRSTFNYDLAGRYSQPHHQRRFHPAAGSDQQPADHHLAPPTQFVGLPHHDVCDRMAAGARRRWRLRSSGFCSSCSSCPARRSTLLPGRKASAR